MKKIISFIVFLFLSFSPTVSFAKGIPLPVFVETGDELFRIRDSPLMGQGYTLGYACKRFGIFGADVWTWDCKMMLVNLDKFSAADIPENMAEALNQKYSLSDRKRTTWNQYGFLFMVLLIAAVVVIGSRKMQQQEAT